MTTYTVSINNGILNINGISYPDSFKNGNDNSTDIRFDENFWRDCFTGDSDKDGCSAGIQNGFIPQGWTKRNGEYIKAKSVQMTSRLEENELIFKAEVLRLKNYKGNISEAVKTQFSTAFPEGRDIFVNKDCGLDPAYFLPNGLCKKSCNIASDVIDPHSSRTADCAKMLPIIGYTLVLDASVFQYLQYPCTCSLTARTTGAGTYDNISFVVDGVDLMTAENINKYFVGNTAKNALFSKVGTPAVKKKNMLLCVAKYSGDTLQSLIQRIFELINAYGNATYIVSTCDSIVSLRSYAFNGSFIEVCNDNAQDKVTQVYVWRPNFANTADLLEIFRAEKTKILAEYNDFIELVTSVEPSANEDNNIYISGSDTTYRFNRVFYIRVAADLTVIRNGINAYNLPAGAPVADIAGAIRIIRTFKVNDFLKVNGPQGQYYCINLATKYTKGNLAILEVVLPAVRLQDDDLHVYEVQLQHLVNAQDFVIGLHKRASQSFFEHATQNYRHMNGGASSRSQKQTFFNPMDINSMMEYFFDLKFYFKNPNAIQIHGESYGILTHKAIQRKGKTYNSIQRNGKTYKKKLTKVGTKERTKEGIEGIEGKIHSSNRTVDLHKQFLTDFLKIFKELFGEHSIDKTSENTKCFDCFSDVINSFAILDIDKPNLRYYSEDAIRHLINQYFSEKQKEKNNELRYYKIKKSIWKPNKYPKFYESKNPKESSFPRSKYPNFYESKKQEDSSFRSKYPPFGGGSKTRKIRR